MFVFVRELFLFGKSLGTSIAFATWNPVLYLAIFGLNYATQHFRCVAAQFEKAHYREGFNNSQAFDSLEIPTTISDEQFF